MKADALRCYKMFYIQGFVFIRWLIRFITDNDHWKSLTALYCISSLNSNETHFVWTFINIISISDEEFISKYPSVSSLHTVSKVYMYDNAICFAPPSSFEAVSGLTSGRRRMTVTGHQVICLVLWNNLNYILLYQHFVNCRQSGNHHNGRTPRFLDSFVHYLFHLLFTFFWHIKITI